MSYRLIRLFALLTVLSLFLSACSDAPVASPDDPYAESAEEEYAEEEYVEDEEIRTSDGEESDVDTDAEAFDSSGEYVSDLGFRPDTDGFGFENYGGQGEENLTVADLQRMFGDQVCSGFVDDVCILSPPGQQWMAQINEAMTGGHCEGMAVLSNLFYTGQIDPAEFGAASTPELEIAGNIELQREIAYWWATQATQPARSEIIPQTPSGVVNTLLTSLAAGPEGGDQFAIGIYNRDGSGGHAITPYAVEDRGDGIYWIMVYDNNYPGEERAVEVDTNADTWTYSGSTNPAEAEGQYEGDGETYTLELAPIAPRLGQQECPFCDDSGSARAGGGLAQSEAPGFYQIWSEGEAELLITDESGRSVGFRDGVFVNEIPGAISNTNKYGVNVWNIDAPPVYTIPAYVDVYIDIDGSRLTETSETTVTLIGPGYALEVSEIFLEPGQVDFLDISPNGELLSYTTESGATPFLLMAVETDVSDYLFGVYGEEMAPGEALNLVLNTEEGWLSLDTIDNVELGSYSLLVARYDDNGEQIFGAEAIQLEPDDVLYVDYLLWPGKGEPMPLDLDYGGDGSVDETIEIEDISDEFAE